MCWHLLLQQGEPKDIYADEILRHLAFYPEEKSGQYSNNSSTSSSPSRPRRSSPGTTRSTSRFVLVLVLARNVFPQNIVVPDVVCPGGNCGLGEDGKTPVKEKRKTSKVNEAVTGSAEGGVDEGEGPDIYIDDAVEEEEEEEDKKDTSKSANL